MPKDATSVGDVIRDLAKRHELRIGAVTGVIDEVVAHSTGNLAVDYLTGVGGLPQGRIIELYGQPSAGKTTTALQAAAELQRAIIAAGRDEYIVYLDFEKALDVNYCAALGLDTSHPTFILAQPHWLEDGADIADKLIRTGKVRLSIFDSVAEMVPKELEFGIRTAAMERARLMNSLLQQLNPLLHANGATAVFLNHLVEAVSMGGARPGLPPAETSPGGKGLKFYASLRLSYKVIRQIKGKAPDALAGAVTDQVIATHVRVKCTKNKVGVPLREAEVRVRLGQGFDNTWTALQVLLAHGIVRKDGAWYRFDADLYHPDMGETNTRTGRASLQGEAAVLDFADTHPDWAAGLVTAAGQAIDAHGEAGLVVGSDEDELFAGLDTSDGRVDLGGSDEDVLT